MSNRPQISWSLTWISFRQRLKCRWWNIRSYFLSLPESYRRRRKLPPTVRRAEASWNETNAQWEIAPLGYPLNGPDIVLREQTVALPGNSEPSVVAAALLDALAQSIYLPTLNAAPSFKGWAAFVRDHRLVGASLHDGEIELAPWVRVHQGRGGSYTGTDHDPVRVSVSADSSEIVEALERCLQLTRELETEW